MSGTKIEVRTKNGVADAGVSHGFAVPDLPVYDHDAAERHYDRLLNLLRETFG